MMVVVVHSSIGGGTRGNVLVEVWVKYPAMFTDGPKETAS